MPPMDESVFIPAAIRAEPNRYACDMLVHLYRLFVPRKTEPSECVFSLIEKSAADNANFSFDIFLAMEARKQLERHVVVCHQVLRLVEAAATNHAIMLTPDTWDFILQFLLAVNDALLAPPIEGGRLGQANCDGFPPSLFLLFCFAFPVLLSRSLPLHLLSSLGSHVPYSAAHGVGRRLQEK